MGAMSVATIRDPEFVNITSISPLVSKCEIKVLYVGHNRNRSYITKETATQMAQTLPGCPIVGYFIENKEDNLGRIIYDGYYSKHVRQAFKFFLKENYNNYKYINTKLV